MKLGSVRALKDDLKSVLLGPALAVGFPTSFAAFTGEAGRSAFTRLVRATHTRPLPSQAVALGVTAGAGRGEFRLGARVQARGAAAQELAASIAKRARGEVDLRVVPRVVKRAPPPSWFQRRHRPLEAGLSVGHVDITAGTLGFVVEDRDAHYVLGNNHVLANVNLGQPGDPVVQPGPIDPPGGPGIRRNEFIGVLDRFVPISFQRANVVDCALAEISRGLEFYAGWTEALAGVVRGTSAITIADLGKPVAKAGRTTGVTTGVITQVEIDRLQVDMGEEGAPKIAEFSDQIEIQGDHGKPFSLGGDSGSLIVDRRGRAVALLFAGGEDEQGVDLTFANRIETVLDKLGVKLAL